MPAPAAKLYTPAILSLSVELAQYPLDRAFDKAGSARARACGSEIDLGLDLDDQGKISDLGMVVKACAIGQASAALFARSAMGNGEAQVKRAVDQLQSWLTGQCSQPDWPGIEILEPALPHTGRHGAILLPWKAAMAALCIREMRG